MLKIKQLQYLFAALMIASILVILIGFVGSCFAGHVQGVRSFGLALVGWYCVARLVAALYEKLGISLEND